MIRLRGQITGLIVLPALAVIMPWRLFFRLARVVSRFSWLFKVETQQAVAGAQQTGLFVADKVWCRHYRMYKIIDAVDPWLSRFRSDTWMVRHIDVFGEWPENTPFIANSMHFGAGFWALRHIRVNACPISLIMRPFDEWQKAFSWPMQVYLKAYEKAVLRAQGAAVTYTGKGFTERFKASLAAGNNQLSMIDVPKGKNINAFHVEFLGRPTYFVNGVVALAKQLDRPVVPYVMIVDFKTGRRQLHIGIPIAQESSLKESIQELAAFFDPFIRHDSAAWQLWGQYSAFLNSEFKQDE